MCWAGLTLSNRVSPSCLQRACYLSLNPQKDETLETEKAQYVLPDGSTLNVSPAKMLRTDFPQPACQIHLSPATSPLPDRAGQVQSTRAALQTRPDWRRELGDPRGPGLRHPEVRHGPQTHALLHHRAVRRVDADQRSALIGRCPMPSTTECRGHGHPLTVLLSCLVFQALGNDY